MGQLTKKADIYSFGVLVLEVISGQSSSKSSWGPDMHVLVEWVIQFSLSLIKCETANLVAFDMLASTLDGRKHHTCTKYILTFPMTDSQYILMMVFTVYILHSTYTYCCSEK